MRARLLALLVALLPAMPAAAAEFRSGQRVDITAPVADSLFTAGETVAVAAPVQGDLFAAGLTVTLSGRTAEDALLAGYDVVVDGSVAADLVAVGVEVAIAGQVAGDARLSGPTVTLARSAQVSGDLAASGGTVELAGTVSGDVQVAAERVVIAGTIFGMLDVAAVELVLEPGAKIMGSIRHVGPRAVEVPPGVTVGGALQYREDDNHGRFGPTLIGTLGKALALFLLGLVVHWLFPALVARACEDIRANPARCAVIGLVALAAAPLAAAVLLLTIIGIPLGLLLLGLYVLALPLGLAVAGFGLADLAAKRRGADVEAGRLKRFALFAVALVFVSLLPLVGALALSLAVALGLGPLVLRLLSGRRRARLA